MVSKIVEISAPNGMHARPAGDLVKLVKSLAPVKITITGESKTVNAGSMLSILSLGLKAGAKVVVNADGEGEEDALAKVVSFIEQIKD